MSYFCLTPLRLMAVAVLVLVSTISSPQSAKAQASDPFIGQLMVFGGNFCPRGWSEADGQLLSIASNSALFSIFGTMYGGDGRSTFAIPDLRGRSAIHVGTGSGLTPVGQGQQGGAETHTLTVPEMPSHNHIVNATNSQGNKFGPGTDYLADPNLIDASTDVYMYHDGPPNVQMDPGMIANTGGNLPHSIRDPYLGLRWCVSLEGVYPSRN